MFTDEQESRMCGHLRDKWRNRKDSRGFHMSRLEVLAVGESVGLTTRQSEALVKSLEGRCWTGKYPWVSKVY